LAKNTGETRRLGAVKRTTQAPNPKMGKRIQFDEHHKIITNTDNPRKRVRKKRKIISTGLFDIFELSKHDTLPVHKAIMQIQQIHIHQP
jgi:hypothetical protein